MEIWVSVTDCGKRQSIVVAIWGFGDKDGGGGVR